jgi:hypothetical protein
MPKYLVRTALFVLIALALPGPGAPAAQDLTPEPPHATGLIPLDAVQVEEIVANWPRIIRVRLNPLGLERVNAVRAAKGKAALEAVSVLPVGAEVEGIVAGRGAAVQAAAEASVMAGDLPVSVDNSLLKFFPPIRNQGSLGSCASFSSTYYQLSYMTAFQRNLDIRSTSDNTNKYSPKWTYNMINGGENNGSSFYQNYAIMEKHGAATWAQFPYDSDFRAWCLDGAVWRNALGARTRVTQYVYEASTDAGLDQLKELLTDGYVLVFGTYINSWIFKNAADDPSTADDDAAAGRPVAYWMGGTDGAHGMTIVGYNDAVWTDINANGAIDAGEKGAFRIANSWGTGWRESGFTWLAYDALRNPSALPDGPSGGRVAAFQSDMVFVLTVRNGYAPLMVGEFTVSAAKRNQLRLNLGRSATSTDRPTTVWTPAMFQTQGGAYAFDGSATAVAGTFVLDLTDILAAGAGLQRYYLGVYDGTAADAVTLSAFKIVDMTTDPDTETASSLVPQTVDNQQAYAYVDYNYAGAAYNDPPQLSSAQVNPEVGEAGHTFSFQVRYYDPDGDAPAVKNVVVDGTSRALSLLSGPASNGWYGLDLTMGVGSHSYYFYVEDGHGESARAPLAGAADGPTVYGLVLASLSPSSAALGGAAFTLTVTGTGFASGAVVTWDGGDRSTTYVSPTRLDAQIAAADLSLGRAVPVAARSASGTPSNILTFAVNNPVPSLSSVSPASATGGASGLAVTLRGSNFAPTATARWNGADRVTTYVGPTEIQAAFTAQDLAAAGRSAVSVFNPAPAGGASGTVSFDVAGFDVAAPSPAASVSAGQSASFALEITPQNGSFDSAVSFSCSGLPHGCTATFSPASVTPGAAVAATTLTLSTKARPSAAAGAAAAGPAGPVPPTALGLALLGAALLALGLASSGRALVRVPARRLGPAAALILLAVWLAACSSGGGGSDDPGTAAGTYEVTVRAISGGLTDTTSVTLTVR